jgi:hypothetical protein
MKFLNWNKQFLCIGIFLTLGPLSFGQQKTTSKTKKPQKPETTNKTVSEPTPVAPRTTQAPKSFESRFGFELSGGLTGINETPADMRLSYGGSFFFHFVPLAAMKLGFFVSKETKLTLPSVTVMKFDIYSILSHLYFVFPEYSLKGLSLGVSGGASRVQYVYETSLTNSQMNTPDKIVVDVAQINTAFVWGPSLRYDYSFSKKVSMGAEATVLYYPEIGQLTPFSTVDVFLNLRTLF